jgi:hypothetical protein
MERSKEVVTDRLSKFRSVDQQMQQGCAVRERAP